MNKYLKRLIWVFILAPLIYMVVIWNMIPESVPLHTNLRGEVDRYGSKTELLVAIIILSLINTIVYFLLPQVYRIDPKKFAAENKSRLYRIAFAVSVFIAAILCLLIYSSIHENIALTGRLLLSGIGLLLAVVGNYVYNIKPNYFAGFRLPWTLSNDENWKRTHLLGGKLLFGGGLLIAVVCLFTPFNAAIIISFSILTLIIAVTTIYSYILYKRINGHHNSTV